MISYIISAAAILGTLFFYAKDLLRLFSTWNDEVTDYNVYSHYLIVSNIAALFITAMLQALTLPKEKDWMERGK
jgi:undecaprenyl pyrophosphate phosphatase UppP